MDRDAPGMPTSYCRRPSPWSAKTSAARRAIRCWSQCTGRCPPMPRRATITTSFPARRASRHCRALHRGPVGAAVAPHLYDRPAARWWSGARGTGVRRVLERRANWCCRPAGKRHCAGVPRAIPSRHRCRRRAAGSRSRPRRSQGSVTPIARGIRPGSRRARAPIAGARFPLQLIANQPATRLHSQLDFGATSQESKVRAASRSASTRRTPRREASAMATSSAFTTIAARASPARC